MQIPQVMHREALRSERSGPGMQLSRSLSDAGRGGASSRGARIPAVFQKGFRPFFLAAGLFALLAVPAWLLLLGGVATRSLYFAPMYWHAHEMVFAFTLAVIGGFLLTAVGNWTHRETLVGSGLAALLAVWVLGRLLLAIPTADGAWRIAAAAVDLSFAPLLALAIARPIIASKNTRNLGFVAILTGFTLANLLMHLAAWGIVGNGLVLGSRLGLNLTLLAIVIMTGRVVPMFTRNASGVEHLRSWPALERASIAAMLLVIVSDLLPVPAWLAGSVAAIAGSLVLLRTRHWGFRYALRQPLVWILHLGHLWIVIGLWLKGLHLLSGVALASTWLHALSAGGIGLLTLGMMVRVTLGHTGRMLAPPWAASAAFVAIALAALLRVVGPVAFPEHFLLSLSISGGFWVLAFLGFLIACGPMLLAARVDGRPG